VWASQDGAPSRRLWRNGNPFSQRTRNLRFKFEGHDAFVEASGGVLRISKTGLSDETSRKSRAVLIDGDLPSNYYGYVSAEGSVTRGLPSNLVAQLDASLNEHATDHVLGASVNLASRTTIVSHGPYRRDGVAFARHDVRRGDRHVEIDCGGAPFARRAVRRLGGDDGLFIESYTLEGPRPTVLFLYGGPGTHINLETGASSDVSALLDAGLNVDVVHYGGSDYTFAQHDRLFRQGAKSVETDARTLSAYIRSKHKHNTGQNTYLMMESFGAYFYRHLDPKALALVDHVLLAQPAGTMDLGRSDFPSIPVGERAQVAQLSTASNAALWGPRTGADEADYFRRLKHCPLARPTTIVVGSKDKVVRPLEDYAPCLGEENVKVVELDISHGSVLLSLSPDAVRQMVEGRSSDK
jgi:pimeloyl-ACP methyl ester carboxylesterase